MRDEPVGFGIGPSPEPAGSDSHPGSVVSGDAERDDREPKPCPRCGVECTYDGWDHVHPNGIGIGSCPPTAAPRDALAKVLADRFHPGREGDPCEQSAMVTFIAGDGGTSIRSLDFGEVADAIIAAFPGITSDELEAQKQRTLHWMNSYNKMLDALRETTRDLAALKTAIEGLCDEAEHAKVLSPGLAGEFRALLAAEGEK